MNSKTNLLKHQSQAVEKLLPSRIGALFMEMGTGKTRTAIDLILQRRRRVYNVFWFCPVSLKETIAYEIAKHTYTSEQDIYIWDNKTTAQNAPDAFWHIIGIESMSSSSRVILTYASLVSEFSFVIVDESSYIKGHHAARTNWITNLSRKARYRLILTGTPISQGVIDLFAQMRFLSPKILGYNSFYSFAHNHLEYSDKYPGLVVRAHNIEWLASKIQPYTYQVTKAECLDLPDKLRETRYFRMTRSQRDFYEEVKDEILINAEEFDSITIFRLFSALQQVVSGFSNDKGVVYHIPHLRLDTLLSTIREIPENEKVIIWAKFVYDIKDIKDSLDKAFGHESTALFYGDLDEKKRNAEVEKFRKTARFFIATPGCGGHGLTLNEAAYVIYYNNGFKYSERLQTEDRCHRIGQERKVTYIDIVCEKSIDERIMSSLYKKGNLVKDFKREIDKVKNKKDRIRELVKSL